MTNALTIVMSGAKQSGKNTCCNYILARYLNTIKHSHNWVFGVHLKTGDLNRGQVSLYGAERYANTSYFSKCGAKIYSFADPLKRFCIDVLGVPEQGCYGTDEEKNAPIEHLLWQNFPVKEVIEGRTGPMSGRDVLQVFGTDVVRKFYNDAWARGTYSSIRRDGHQLSLICDARFPNELDMGESVNAKSIRMLRRIFADVHKSETALDDRPLNRYTVILDNRELDIAQQCKALDPYIDEWFKEARF
jgi:hypothetical protein